MHPTSSDIFGDIFGSTRLFFYKKPVYKKLSTKIYVILHVFLFIRTYLIRTRGLEMGKETMGKQWAHCLRTKES